MTGVVPCYKMQTKCKYDSVQGTAFTARLQRTPSEQSHLGWGTRLSLFLIVDVHVLGVDDSFILLPVCRSRSR
jgi:hypothetical protein